MAMVGRKPLLTPEQQADVRRRYALYRENFPQRIAAEFGISRRTLNCYISGRHKDRRA